MQRVQAYKLPVYLLIPRSESLDILRVAAPSQQLLSTRLAIPPELNLVGTFAGAPPADLRQVLEAVDGSSIVAALGYTLNGYLERNPELLSLVDEEFNEEGKRFLHDAEISCIGDVTINWGFTDTRTLTKSGDSFSEVIDRHPELKAGVNHALPLFTDMPQGLQYLIGRFNGIAPHNDCGSF